MPTIETLEDWNARLSQCGCCPMPLCVAPIIESERFEVEFISNGFQEDFVGGGNTLYLSAGWSCTVDPCALPNATEPECEDEEFTFPTGTATVDGIFVTSVKGCNGTLINIPNSSNFEDGFNHTSAYHVMSEQQDAAQCTENSQQENDELANSMSWQDFEQKSVAFIGGSQFDDYYRPCEFEELVSTNEGVNITNAGTRTEFFDITLTKTRFKFKKPTSENYTYYKCIYDIYSFYSDRTEEFLKDQEVVFTGNESDFIELVPPPEEGYREVVNIRFECYRSPDYGNKPQRIGQKVVPSSFSPPP